MNTPAFDLESAATGVEAVITGIAEEQLDDPTPCDATTVRDLLAHMAGLTEAFRQAATKEAVGQSISPTDDEPELPADWRDRIPTQLKTLVAAWRAPEAWSGETEAGGVTLPAAEMATVALNELVIHGWDLARATHQPYNPDAADLDVLLDMLRTTRPEGTPGLFGPVVPVPDNSSTFDRVLALTGRDPNWSR
ncbi:TIGR03086 family metal-binding protein [Nocardia sp. NPDC050406]|uniref:TIGR03086 family metal-binding protein n=1 Tax=Nocardia sp. NPDC050406 TaxID=3364318 RepID=UPI00378EFDCE